MNIYLHKDGQQIGPFTESEARAHLSNGSIGAADLAWVEGNSDWQPLSKILPPVTPSQPIVQSPIPTVVQVVAPRPLSHKGVSLASWTLLSLCCIASLIPGLGFGVWLVAAPLLLITFVLGIIAISRGGTLQGVLILLASLIVVPIFVFIAPIVTTGAVFAATSTVEKSGSPKSVLGQ
jgi:GYF domain 2